MQALHAAGICALMEVVYNHIDVAPSFTSPVFPYSLYQYDGWSGDPCGIYRLRR